MIRPTLALSFLDWRTAAVAASIAIPTLVILYFLKLRRRDLEISTTLLWKKAIQDLQANAPFQKLRRNILLLLQLLALIAALVAVGQPEITGATLENARHVIMIDRSASMGATDGGTDENTQTRLEAAKKRALDLVTALREPNIITGKGGDEAMVIAFDSIAEVRQTFTSDKGLLKAAIEGISGTDAPSSFLEAMDLARAHAPRRTIQDRDPETGEVRGTMELPPEEIGTLHILSDGRLPDAAKASAHARDTINYLRVGQTDAANVGITSLRAARAFDDPNKLSVFVGLESTDRARRDVDVEVIIDGQVAGIRTVAMEPATIAGVAISDESNAEGGEPRPPGIPTPSANGVVVPLDRAEGGVVEVRLTHPGSARKDALAVDDTAWLVVPPAKRLSIAVVTAGNLFLKEAMEGLPSSRLESFTPDAYQSALKEGKAAFDVTILDGWLPAGADGKPSVPPGRWLVFNAVPEGLGMVETGKSEGVSIIDWRRDHPVLRAVNLDPLRIGEMRNVELVPDGPAKVLARGDSGPAILEVTTADRRAIIVPFDVAASTWPFGADMVVFLGLTLPYLGDDGALGLAQTIKPGGELMDRLPPGAADVRIEFPQGGSAGITPAADGRVIYGPITRTGIYALTWNGPRGPLDREGPSGRSLRPVTANLVDPEESDVAAAESLELASHTAASAATGASRATHRLWPWLLLGALGVVLLEWFVYNRKVHV